MHREKIDGLITLRTSPPNLKVSREMLLLKQSMIPLRLTINEAISPDCQRHSVSTRCYIWYSEYLARSEPWGKGWVLELPVLVSNLIKISLTMSHKKVTQLVKRAGTAFWQGSRARRRSTSSFMAPAHCPYSRWSRVDSFDLEIGHRKGVQIPDSWPKTGSLLSFHILDLVILLMCSSLIYCPMFNVLAHSHRRLPVEDWPLQSACCVVDAIPSDCCWLRIPQDHSNARRNLIASTTSFWKAPIHTTNNVK